MPPMVAMVVLGLGAMAVFGFVMVSVGGSTDPQLADATRSPEPSAALPATPAAAPYAPPLPPRPERRTGARHPKLRHVEVRRGDRWAATHRTFALDLSMQGAMVAGPHDLKPLEQVWIAIELTRGGPKVEGMGRVVHQTVAGQSGIHFEAMNLDDRSVLAEHLGAESLALVAA